MKKVILQLLLIFFLGGKLFAGDSTAAVGRTYADIRANTQKALVLCSENPQPQYMQQVLSLNEANCKNMLTLSDAPADFKKAMLSYVEEFRFAAAVLVLRSARGERLTDSEVRRIQSWDRKRARVDALAQKYGVTPAERLPGK